MCERSWFFPVSLDVRVCVGTSRATLAQDVASLGWTRLHHLPFGMAQCLHEACYVAAQLLPPT